MRTSYYISKLLLVLKTVFFRFKRWNDLSRWSNPSKLLSEWEPRTELIASFIPAGLSVFEFGAGRMVLKKYLNSGCKYTPSDLLDRGEGFFVCDLNSRELPVFPKHDVAVFSGVLEYVFDVPRLILHISTFFDMVIFSYATTDEIPEKLIRRSNGWVNDYCRAELEGILVQHGYYCEKSIVWRSQMICKFIKKTNHSQNYN